MIEEIRIANLGVIVEGLVEFGPGFNVLTGETGAGKTMVVTSLNLLLGGKADSGAVRHGAEKAEVEGRYAGAADIPGVAERVREAGGDLEDQALIVARSVAVSGRSRAFVGGRSAPAVVLSEVGARLVALHGQHDQQRLLLPGEQRDLLDRYAGPDLQTALSDYGADYARLKAAEKELSELTTRARERAQQADLLRFGLEEIAAVTPVAGEDEDLAAESDRLTHAVVLRDAAEGARVLLASDGESTDVDVLTLMSRAKRQIDSGVAHDPVLKDLSVRLTEAAMLAGEVASDLAAYASGMDTDPGRLAAVESRRAALGGLLRKYGETVDEVLAWEREAAATLLTLDSDGGRIEELSAEIVELRESAARKAVVVSELRSAAASALGTATAAELVALAMPSARIVFTVRCAEKADGLLLADGRRVAFAPHGIDDVEILLASSSAAPLRPIGAAASGGELSRIMLALEVVLAELDPVPTMIFDEVDAGVGGAAAVEIGRRLQRLATHTQVIVVTHLPQVAAFADHHVVVDKGIGERGAVSSVRRLSEAERVTELSRMMAGQSESASAAAHATELLDLAAAERPRFAGSR